MAANGVHTSPPLDLTSGYVAHRGLREELARLTVATREVNPADIRQVRAVEDHLALVLRFLAAHHREEDALVFPRVRARVGHGLPVAGRVFTDLAVDHDSLDVLTRRAGDTQVPLRERSLAIGRLHALVARHTYQEEREMFPLMRRHVSNLEQRRLLRRTLRGWGRDLPAFVALYFHHADAGERARLLRFAPFGAGLMWRLSWKRGYERRRVAAYGTST
ncbi:hemerythrin domain-containing protein [Yinghuangia seranimata]|uniref:hemerythrin domain-containing protein n=1 Tax=Yinghuangia seranimata TaxID=408067 RepID=UPI00248C35C9|nr:hemerythrin domain-containing protein [Yinghuangia seranimata]MDI2125318.1 hemerythrin domain-containing protein [Yinghuangia seranimata]